VRGHQTEIKRCEEIRALVFGRNIPRNREEIRRRPEEIGRCEEIFVEI